MEKRRNGTRLRTMQHENVRKQVQNRLPHVREQNGLHGLVLGNKSEKREIQPKYKNPRTVSNAWEHLHGNEIQAE